MTNSIRYLSGSYIAKSALLLSSYGIPFLGSFLTIKMIISVFGLTSYAAYVFSFGAAVFIRIISFSIIQPVIIRFFNDFKEAKQARSVITYYMLFTICSVSLFISLYVLDAASGICLSTKAIECADSKILAGLALGVGLGSASTIAEIDNAHCSQIRGAFFLSIVPIFQIIVAFVNYVIPISIMSYIIFVAIVLSVISIINCLIILSRFDGGDGDFFAKSVISSDVKGFALGISYWTIPTIITKALDKTFFGIYLIASDLAIYALCLLLSQNVLQATSTMLLRYFNPYIFGNIRDGDEGSLKDAHHSVDLLCVCTVIVGLILSLIYFLFGEAILALLADKEIPDGYFVLQVLALTATVQAVGDVQSVHGQVSKITKPFFLARCASAATFIIGVVFILPHFGLRGAVLTIAGSQMVGALANITAGRTVQRVGGQRAS